VDGQQRVAVVPQFPYERTTRGISAASTGCPRHAPFCKAAIVLFSFGGPLIDQRFICRGCVSDRVRMWLVARVDCIGVSCRSRVLWAPTLAGLAEAIAASVYAAV
jgi:hypothetical protein